jgi:hypothetical protein
VGLSPKQHDFLWKKGRLHMRPKFAFIFVLAFLGINLVAPQFLIADFYVIPIGPGSKSISYSDVRHIRTSAWVTSTSTLIDPSTNQIFTVPDDKVFIITNIVLTGGDDDTVQKSTGTFYYGNGGRNLLHFVAGQTIQLQFPVGLVMFAGDTCSVRVDDYSPNVQAYVTGYLTNP